MDYIPTGYIPTDYIPMDYTKNASRINAILDKRIRLEFKMDFRFFSPVEVVFTFLGGIVVQIYFCENDSSFSSI